MGPWPLDPLVSGPLLAVAPPSAKSWIRAWSRECLYEQQGGCRAASDKESSNSLESNELSGIGSNNENEEGADQPTQR